MDEDAHTRLVYNTILEIYVRLLYIILVVFFETMRRRWKFYKTAILLSKRSITA